MKDTVFAGVAPRPYVCYRVCGPRTMIRDDDDDVSLQLSCAARGQVFSLLLSRLLDARFWLATPRVLGGERRVRWRSSARHACKQCYGDDDWPTPEVGRVAEGIGSPPGRDKQGSAAHVGMGYSL